MNHGLYTAYLGMRARMRTLEVIANNVANASTTGFKADCLYYRSVEAAELEAMRLAAQTGVTAQPDTAAAPPDPAAPNGQTPAETAAPALLPSRALGVVSGEMMDFSVGALRQTGRSLDVALEGDGFLVVQTPRGERYTRDGSLTLDANGQLVTAHGDLVVGEGGPITVRPGEVSIGADGRITVAGQEMGRLRLVRFQDARTALSKEGSSLFAATGSERPQEATQPQVHQGMLESSNVNPIGELATMMQINREFEALQRSVNLLMSMRKIAAEIGRI